jgi:hypothetical protein
MNPHAIGLATEDIHLDRLQMRDCRCSGGIRVSSQDCRDDRVMLVAIA